MLDSIGPGGRLVFKPLLCGLDPELSWQSLRLFEREVLPRIDAGP